MSYYVSLGDLEFDKALSVTRSSDRNISTYDSVGGGKFAVPQNKELREWTIKCELDDFDVIKQLDKIQRSKKPVRLVISSDEYKESERVLLKSHHQEEEYAGVFPTTLNLVEYSKIGVRTAAVPYVAREGTRVLPAQVTIGDGKGGTVTPYDLVKAAADQAKYDGEVNARAPQYEVIDSETGKRWDNPVTIPDGTKVNVNPGIWQERPEFADNGTLVGLAWTTSDAVKNATKAALAAISDSYKYYSSFNK